jgi:hypothetical protein
MSGERDPLQLQKSMAPQLLPETYVYCTFPDFQLPDGLLPICTFREAEGLTAILERTQAERAQAPFIFEARLITLTVHSSLDAIGFLARILTCLAHAGIPCNAIAAYHHDHLFVPVDRAQEALALLQSLSADRAQTTV